MKALKDVSVKQGSRGIRQYMKIPQIKTRHKIRDTKMCLLYARDLMPAQQIADKFKISLSRTYAILYANKEFLRVNKEWEKTKRVIWYKRQIGNKISKKDPADLQNNLRIEIEGEKPLFEQHMLIDKRTFVYLDPKAQEEENRNNRIISQLPAK